MWPFDTKQTATLDSVESGIDAVQKQIDELKSAVAALKVAQTNEVVSVNGNQAGGARRSTKRSRRTLKNKHRK